MASLPREVHEVLEEEYVSMYGPLATAGVGYDGDAGDDGQIADVAWAGSILVRCGIRTSAPTTAAEVAGALNEVLRGDEGSIRRFEQSPALTNAGRALFDRYAEYVDLSDLPPREQHASDESKPCRRCVLHRRIIDDAMTGAVKPLRDVRLSALYGQLHARAKNTPHDARSALCISGGGIRSATFALGVIQGLASARVLDKFDYLSTVSGGGYVGSWLSSWARRHPQGITGVQKELAESDSAVGGTRGPQVEEKSARARKIEPEPPPVRHLREYSNYLSPRLGLLSGDSWTLVALYLRNLLLNLLVLVPLLALVLAVPRIYAGAIGTMFGEYTLDWPWVAAGSLLVAFIYIAVQRPIEGRPVGGKGDGAYLIGAIVPLVTAAIAITLTWARGGAEWRRLAADRSVFGASILAGLAVTVIPLTIYYLRVYRATRGAWSTTATASRRSYFAGKLALESLGIFMSMVVAAGLLVLLGLKVFDQPTQKLDEIIDVAMRAPVFRAGESLTSAAALFICFAVPAVLLVFYVQACIFIGISSHRSEDHDREWWGRAGAWLLVAVVVWAVGAAITIYGPVALYHAPILLGSVGGVSGVVASLVGFSSKTPANRKEKEEAGVAGKAANFSLSIAVPLFVLFFLAAIALGTTWLIQTVGPAIGTRKAVDWKSREQLAVFQSKAKGAATRNALELTDETTSGARVSLPMLRSLEHLKTIQNAHPLEVEAIALLALLALLLSRCVGVNRFSIHALYRNRLIRAYLGASRYSRNPHPFTGFDEKDNMAMADLRVELLWPNSVLDARAMFLALRAGATAEPTLFTRAKLLIRQEDAPAPAPAASDEEKLARELWNRLYPANQDHVRGEPTREGVDAVVQNLNAIIADAHPARLLECIAPSQLEAAETKLTPPMRNRLILERFFGAAIRSMPRPATSDRVDLVDNGNGSHTAVAHVAGGASDGAPRRAPLHVVNMALNLVSGDKLAWQQRMAESFTATPYHAGSLYVGYRDSREYGGREGISLGTAVTISGAAASPNMGYHSSPALAFLMTLFNIRLGAWLGNPGVVGESSYRKGHPRWNLDPLVAEAVGWTKDDYEWVYLSDGGHFENLGLYEMVLRRCHNIVLSDAGADPSFAFDDLGNAIRKIRTDLGVSIDIRKAVMIPRRADSLTKQGRYVAIATIGYKAVDGPDAVDGTLIYLKPGCYDDPYFPRDVYNYACGSPDFPHESTGDQFFSESQFESYRALGRHVVNEICGNYPRAAGSAMPLAKTYPSVAALVDDIRTSATSATNPEPAEIVAKAIREASQRPLLRR